MRRPEAVLGITAIFLVGALVGVFLNRVEVPGFGDSQSRKIEDALTLIRKRYVDVLSDDELAEAAIQGMVERLDPYSTYIDARTLGPVQDELEGEFGGVGIWFEMVSDSARVVSVIPGGPSEHAGVLAGDRIVAVDDSSCVGEPSRSIQSRIRGPRGEVVRLTIYRPVLSQKLTVPVERAVIPIRSVEAAFRLDDETAYVRLSRFTSGTAEEFRKAVSDLRSAGPLRGLLIDVRNNPGGILEAAVRVSDELLSDGVDIVSTEGRGMEKREVYASSAGGMVEDTPVIILVNSNSASASEILAGAIQDNDRGLVIGQPTFGKGLVQRQFVFGDGSALHLTVARYYTPAGRAIQNDLDRNVPVHARADTVLAQNDSDPADSLLQFRTLHGRILLGGKGIYPDHIPPSDSMVSVFELVFRSGLDLGFSRRWFDTREASVRQAWSQEEDRFVDEFRIDDETWQEFVAYAAREAGTVWGRYAAADIALARSRISTLLTARIGQSLFGPRIWFSIVSKVDPDITFARAFWDEASALPGAPGR